MRICFVGQGAVRAFNSQEISACDLLLFGFNGIDEVSYERELKGETTWLEDVALLSKGIDATVVSGCITDTRGHKRKSAVVAERGKLMGVSDMLNVIDGAINCGAALRVYETKVGRMGLLVAEDLYFPETIRALAMCGSDFIVCPFGVLRNTMPQVLLRAYAYLHGIPIFLCGIGYSMAVEAGGTVSLATPQSPVSFLVENRKEFHVLEMRKRGVFET